MKIELRTLVLATAFILVASHLAASAQSLPAAIDPVTGLPAAIDPVTGLPTAPSWEDPNWPEPSTVSNGNSAPIVLTNVDYAGMPLSEIARDLHERFQEQFDLILPENWLSDPSASPMHDLGSFTITLKLKNVTASEVFKAMNLYFDNEKVPLRWALKINGSRPVVLLQVLAPASSYAAPEKHMVFFVGDLISDDKTGNTKGVASPSEITAAINTAWTTSGLQPADQGAHLDFYAPAQLLIVNGNAEQIDLAQQTLAALKQKSDFDHFIPETGNRFSTPANGASGGGGATSGGATSK